MPNRPHFSSCLDVQKHESSQKVSCVMPGDLWAPCSIMKQGTESVLAFCNVIRYITSFGLEVMKLGRVFWAHTAVQFSKFYWTEPSPVKCILSILWDTNLAITIEFQCSWSWVTRHKWRISLPLGSVRKKCKCTGNH